jgi:signal transduction histidine kinase
MKSANKLKQGRYLTQDSPVSGLQAEAEVIFSCIGDGAIATNEYGHITRINPAALAILDIKPTDALNKWFPKVINAVKPDNTPLPLIERPIFKMFLTGKSITEKLYYKLKSGRVIPIYTTVSPIMVGDSPVGAIEVFRDITHENEIDKMKSEFISIASHQLRTPLSTIKTYAHMLSEGYMGDVSKEQAKALKTITKATNNMNELIATLLNISRIESGGIKVYRKPCDIRQVAEEVVKELTLTAKDKSIKLNLHIPKQPVIIKTDSLIVKEVLNNLVGNAIKYTPRRGMIDVTVLNQRDQVQFSISDTGFGIPEQSQDKIFSKFFRAKNVIQKETSGTGLGLYVVKGLVLILHGKIWFKSAEHTGSTFFVSIPKIISRKTNGD